jgi:DNA-binding HxlR family transcriptional regulator
MSSILKLEDIVALGRYRWIVPVLAYLHARRGARFIEMLNGLGIARETLSRTLDAGLEKGWLVRNNGHGHPLRPEYLLSAEGERLGGACTAIVAIQAALCLPPAALTRWSLPIVRLLAEGRTRFNQIEGAMPEANPRGLTQSLKALAGYALITRRIVDDYPPRADYGLSANGKSLALALCP